MIGQDYGWDLPLWEYTVLSEPVRLLYNDLV